MIFEMQNYSICYKKQLWGVIKKSCHNHILLKISKLTFQKEFFKKKFFKKMGGGLYFLLWDRAKILLYSNSMQLQPFQCVLFYSSLNSRLEKVITSEGLFTLFKVYGVEKRKLFTNVRSSQYMLKNRRKLEEARIIKNIFFD